jgi:hypothetical protein
MEKAIYQNETHFWCFLTKLGSFYLTEEKLSNREKTKLHTEELYNLYFSPNIDSDQQERAAQGTWDAKGNHSHCILTRIHVRFPSGSK